MQNITTSGHTFSTFHLMCSENYTNCTSFKHSDDCLCIVTFPGNISSLPSYYPFFPSRETYYHTSRPTSEIISLRKTSLSLQIALSPLLCLRVRQKLHAMHLSFVPCLPEKYSSKIIIRKPQASSQSFKENGLQHQPYTLDSFVN